MKRRIPFWASLSVALNGFLLLAISLGYWKPQLVGLNPPTAPAVELSESAPVDAFDDRPTRSYEQWLGILSTEAKAVAQKNPESLTVLLGDSLTLWFPPELLAANRNWLNQGISGENASGLLKRLNLLDELKPQTVLVMIGVNDLIKGASDETLVTNYQKIIDDLKSKHPDTEVVVQSILPHGGDRLTVDDRTQVLQVSNERIVQLNRQLKQLAQQQNVKFLDLHSVFVDRDGLLREELSTDGLHLSAQGYGVWQSAMQMFSQLELKPPIIPADVKVGEPKPEVQEALPAAPGSDATTESDQ
ncbi:G-D-S-L family lipolytic protein [filamentous cyanobacterium LEGE 11480]|uniref:G-D-S-L family lipolytic protein n=2 Tax=Romeriopsis TaxID=2992131 RepID=A0A928Z0L6_9CYAN|nr:G-D-S-L family lipolytic protein [Romeriopsis navalis LEGE 11480]